MEKIEFDLNINNYNIIDLEQLFKLKTELKYSANAIEFIEYQLREQLFKTGYITKQLKPNIVQFLSLAKTRLIQAKCVPHKNPSIMQESWQLDKTDFPKLEHTTSRENEIVIKPNPTFTYTNNSDYFTGTLNPLEKRIITKNISIDSLFRNNYNNSYSGDYIYTLPETMNNVTSMKLTALELSNTWYSYSSKNNTNTMSITTYATIHDLSGTHHIITVPDGNYLSTDFIKLINLLLSVTSTNITIDISNYSTKTIFCIKNSISSFSHFKLDFQVAGIPLNKTMGWMLGFRESSYIVKIPTIPTNYYTSIGSGLTLSPDCYGYLESEGSFGSLLDDYIFIDVDDFHNNFPINTIISVNNTNQSYLGQNILARITITIGQNITLTDNAQDLICKRREYFGPIKLEKLRIRLLDRFGDVLDINNNDYSLLLEFTQLYS